MATHVSRTQTGREYWRGVLTAGGFTPAPRWTLHPVTGVGQYETPAPDDTVTGLRRLAGELAVPLSSILLAAHAKVLAALSGEREITTGYVAEGGSLLPCRLTTAPASWRQLLHNTHQVAAELQAHQHVPAEDIDAQRRELGLTGQLFETVLDPTAVDEDLTGDTVLRVGIAHHDGRLVLRLRYRTEMLDADGAARIAGYHLAALAMITDDPDAEHARQSLLSDQELRFQLEELAGPVRELPDRRVHELFEDRVRMHPDALAAVHAGRQWTYGELNARANRLARALVDRGLAREGVVAVVTERNLDWMAAVLAVFKAGGVYLPIEPHFPAERIAATLSRAECTLVLTESGSTTTLDQALDSLPGVQRLFVEAAYEEDHADDDLGIHVTPGQLAYIYFTSGSTGEPKGAMCEHAGMLNHLYAKIDDLKVGEGQVVAQTAPQCFDISLWQLLSALLAGGRTLLVEQDVILDVPRFLDTLTDGKVTVLQVVPSYLEAVLAELEQRPRTLPDLRCVSVTGEALKKELAERWFAAEPEIKLVNAYGLTETSDDTNHEVMDRVPDRILLGRAVNNVHVYVVDEHLAPVPLGAPGVIAFSGVCVGRGYINDSERTQAAYLADPHREGMRLYLGGDYGRWQPEGKLEFLGRRDTQVKIRGFRIEIGEIENTLLRIPGVRDGAVVVAERADQSKHLVAFYSGPGPLDTGTLTDRLGASLPEYMVPSAFHWRESLPLTANSKIDKKTLVALAAQLGTTEDDHEPLATPTEQRLAAAWGQVLGVPQDRIGRRDHFFDRGGTSLSAVKLAIALDRAVSLKDVTAHPVLTDLAALVDNKPQRHTTEPLTPSSTTSKGKSTMPNPIPASLLEADLHPGKPSILHTDTPDHAPAWAAEHHHALRTLVTEHGALLIRGLHLRDADEAGAVFHELAPALMTDKEAFAPRRTYTPGVYSSSTWPPNQPMCMHHELSYTHRPPGLMLFACLTAPTTGGATAIADAPTVLKALPTELVHRFEQEGWLLTRTYNDEIGAPYAQAFGTDNRTAIENYCRTHAIDFAWQPDGSLRTRQHRAAVTAHPVTGRRCWFNQIAFLNEWTIEPEIRDYLIDVYGADQLPFNTRFGSGDPIGEDIIQLLGDTYTAHTIREPWQSGDLMLVDNLRTAHSREAYEGPREVLVAMAEPLRLADRTPNAEVSPR